MKHCLTQLILPKLINHTQTKSYITSVGKWHIFVLISKVCINKPLHQKPGHHQQRSQLCHRLLHQGVSPLPCSAHSSVIASFIRACPHYHVPPAGSWMIMITLIRVHQGLLKQTRPSSPTSVARLQEWIVCQHC